MFNLVLLVLTLAALAASYWKDPARTRKALMMSKKSFLNLLPSLLGLTGLIGLVLALTPEQVLVELFQRHGWEGFLLVSAVGSITTIPGPIAFPLAGSLLSLGASVSAMAAFITTLTMVGAVTAPMEMEFFGKRFTLMRNGLSFVLAVVIGGVMGGILG